jgi:peptide-methionine (S)-S-oxide reductase
MKPNACGTQPAARARSKAQRWGHFCRWFTLRRSQHKVTAFINEENTMTQDTNNMQTLVLGGGCFWCTEAVYVTVKGITDVESGYSNGQETAPTYEQVCTGRTGCNEVVKLAYDPAKISTREILEIFFVIHDPTTLNRQGNDVGTQYRSGIYFSNDEQRSVAQTLIDELTADNAFGSPIVTELVPVTNYFVAEEYHQDFFERNPHQGYCMAVAAPKVAKFRKTFVRLMK